MNKFYETLQNLRGDILPGYRAQVVDSSGATVPIFTDKSGTRFADSLGNAVDYATADASGLAAFYWTAALGQVLQVLDTGGNLVREITDFADNFVTSAGDVALEGAGALTLTGTVNGRLLREIHLQDVAGFTTSIANPITAGAANRTALQAAWDYLVSVGGGTIRLPRAGFYLSPTTLTMNSAAPMAIVGASANTLYSSQIWPSSEDIGVPGNWVLHISDNGESPAATGTPTLEGFTIRPRVAPADLASRVNVNGLKVGRTNHCRIKNVFVQFLKGHGFWSVRAHNSEIAVHTFECGDETYGTWGHTYVGDSEFPANELKIGGTTETDINGMRFHHCVLVRTMVGGIKIHGSPDTKRLLEIYRCGLVDMRVIPTLGWGVDGAIYVGDDSGVAIPTEAAPCLNTTTYTSGKLTLTPFTNFENHGAAGNHLIVHDCGGSGLFTYAGEVPSIPGVYGTDYKLIRFTATTPTNNEPDIQGLKVRSADITLGITDERLFSKKTLTSNGTRYSGIALPARTALRGNAVYQQAAGEFSGYELAASAGVSPASRFLAQWHSTATGGNKIYDSHVPHNFSAATVSASTFLGQRTFARPAGVRDRVAAITFTAGGVAAWDAANNWKIRLLKFDGAYIDLNICSDLNYTTSNLYPDKYATVTFNGSTSTAPVHALQYWTLLSTAPQAIFNDNTAQILRIELIKTGNPANLTNVDLTVWTTREA